MKCRHGHLGERLASAIHKCARFAYEFTEAAEHPVINHGLCGGVVIASKPVFPSRAVQCFVTIDPLLRGQDGLKCNEIVGGAVGRGLRRCNFEPVLVGRT